MMRGFVLVIKLSASCAIPLSLAGCFLPERSSSIEVEKAIVVDDDLKLVVKSAQHSTPFYAHSTKTYNVRHYYIGMDLRSKAPIQTAATIVGPLWIEKDVAWQAELLPRWPHNKQAGFDPNGELQRITWNQDQGKWDRDRLSIEKERSSWIPAGSVSPIPGPTNIFASNLRTRSGNWQVYINANNAPELYKTATGERTNDPWLEDVISKLYRVRGIGVEHRIEDIKVTDDRKYVVYWPSTSFDWNGQAYPITERPSPNHKGVERAQERAVIFERPSPEGVVVSKGDWRDGWSGQPLGFFSIGGELLFLKQNTNYLALVDQQGRTKFHVNAPDFKVHYHTTQDDLEASRLIFFDNFIIPNPFEVRIWDYKSGSLAAFKFQLASFFETSFSGALVPRKMVRTEPEKPGER
jgi:hypothetical protein